MAGERDVENNPEAIDQFTVLQPDEVTTRSQEARDAYIALLRTRSGYLMSEEQLAAWWKYAGQG